MKLARRIGFVTSSNLVRPMKVLTEFVGTFLFLFVIALAAVSGSPLAPLAIGGALMVMVYMGGHRSGAHYNPAVSFALFLQKKMPAKDFGPYVVAQVVAGILAFWTGYFVTGRTVAIGPNIEHLMMRAASMAGASEDARRELGKAFPLGASGSAYPVPALIVEILFTMALVLVVMNVAASKKTEGNNYYGLAIGFTIVAAAVAGGGISGGAFNPAVGIGATIIHALFGRGTWEYLWIPIVGPLVGAAMGSYIWSLQERATD